MALDFSILGKSGSPERTVSLNLDVHSELLVKAADLGLSCFEPFFDYYEDAEIPLTDFPDLIKEIRLLKSQNVSIGLKIFLHDLEGLVGEALTCKVSIHTIAD